MKRALLAFALLAAPALAQEPDDATKKAALMRAYRDNGSVAWGGYDATVREIPIVRVAKPLPPAPPPQQVKVAEIDICARHHLRKVVTHGGRSWRCRR
jgi:hypothetical protein